MDNKAFQWNPSQYGSAVGKSVGLWGGIGLSGYPVSDDGIADKNWIGMFTKTTAATGDNRGVYWRHTFEGAGGGEVLRPVAKVNTSNVATGGTVNGIHTTLSVATSSSVSGAGNAIRATLEAAAATRTLSGTCAALQLDSNIGANNTVPSSWSFIRVTDSGSVKVGKLFNLPTAGAGLLVSTHTTDAMTHSVKCVLADGTAIYLMATTTASNRA